MSALGGAPESAPASSARAPYGWVWRFRLVADAPGRRAWLRFEVDVAGPYLAASALAKCSAAWRGGRRPWVLGVRRLRAASAGREPSTLDARFV
jgi:hypothetical protein